MATGDGAYVTVEGLRSYLAGAPGYDDAWLGEVIAAAEAQVAALLAPEWRPGGLSWQPPGQLPPENADLTAGMTFAAALEHRNRESPTGAPTGYGADEGGIPITPLVWHSRLRSRLGRYLSPGTVVG